MICLPLLAKHYSRANGDRRLQIEKHVVVSAFSAVRWRQTRPKTSFYSFLSTSQSSEIENETVNGKEAEAETMECENGKLFYAFNSIS